MILAVLSGLSRIGEYSLDPVMNALRCVPLLGLLPLFIVWFGIGDLPKDLIVLLGALFPMYINTFAGIRSVDPSSASSVRCSGSPGGSWCGTSYFLARYRRH